MPFGCNCDSGYPSTLTVEMRSPDSAKCDGIIGIDECGLKIRSIEWEKPHSIVIIHSGNGKYDMTFSQLRKVQLQTRDLYLHPIWSQFILPEISVNMNLINRAQEN